MSSFTGIYDKIVNYKGDKITIIIDDVGMPWFSGFEIASILKYENTKSAILNSVDLEDKTQYKNLFKYLDEIPKYAQGHAIFINEYGLYSLIFSSTKPEAKKFKKWIRREVLPSLRKTGIYVLSGQSIKKMEKINEKLKLKNSEMAKEIKACKNNQKRVVHPKKSYIYVFRLINTNNKKLLKMGNSGNLTHRIDTLNTTVPDNIEMLYKIEVTHRKFVEECVKIKLSSKIYRKNKEYFVCTLKKMKEIISMCADFAEGKSYCVSCDKKINKKQLDKHTSEFHADENFLIDINSIQNGGDDLSYNCNNMTNYSEILSDEQIEADLYDFFDVPRVTNFERNNMSIDDIIRLIYSNEFNLDDFSEDYSDDELYEKHLIKILDKSI